MKFHRLTYPIFMIPEVEDRGEPRIETHSGWADENEQFGFFNTGKRWVATDLRSGRMITRGATRKACAEWIEANRTKLELKYASKEYQVMVFEFEAMKRRYNYD